MAKVTVNTGSAHDYIVNACDLIVTDPPFDMGGAELTDILDNATECDHLVLITTIKQLIGLLNHSDWVVSFDFVIDQVVPKKSKSKHQPNYTHSTGVYLTRRNARSIFNRKLRQRSDTFDNNGYWPTVLRAPRERLRDHGMAKNEQAITDIIGSFDAKHIYDPFAGSGTVGFACVSLEKHCTLTELDPVHAERLIKHFGFLS